MQALKDLTKMMLWLVWLVGAINTLKF